MAIKNTVNKNSILIIMLWPILFEYILAGMISNGNQLILNDFSPTAVAATSAGGQFLSMVVTMFNIFSVGQSILLAPLWGAGKYREGSKILWTSLVGNVFFSVLLSGVGLLLIPAVMNWMNVPQELQIMARSYLLVVVGCSVFQSVTSTLSAALRAMGKMKAVMLGNLLINISCLGMNFLILEGVPRNRQSIAMYAFAGVFAQILGGVFFFIALHRDSLVVSRISFREFRYEFIQNSKRIVKLGFFGGMEGIIYLISQTAVVAMIGLLGTQALTAKGYVGNLITYMSLPSNAVSLAAAAMIGMAAGRHKEKEMHQFFSQALKVSLTLTLCICAISLCLGHRFMSMYTSDPKMLKLCMQIIVIDVVLEVARSIAALLVVSLKAIGDVRQPFRMVIIGSILNLAVSWSCGIVLGMGLSGIWLGYGADLVFRSIMGMYSWRKHKIKHNYPIWE